jgi:large repetitive protein
MLLHVSSQNSVNSSSTSHSQLTSTFGRLDACENKRTARTLASESRWSRLKTTLTCVSLTFLGVFFGVAPTVEGQVAPLTPAYKFAASVTIGAAVELGTATVKISSTGSISAISVLAQGIANQDFVLGTGGSCTVGTNYFAGQTCTVAVSFQPVYPGLRQGAVVLLANDGSVLGSELIAGTAVGSIAIIVPAFIQGAAGNGQWIYQGDGGSAQNASLFLPMAAVPDEAKNLFISDSNNERVRRVDAATGIISTVAGNGSPGFSGDGGLATNASLETPSALAIDGAGNLYICDSGNNAVRMVSAATGVISTVAGIGSQPGYSGDGGQAINANLSHPNGLAFDGDHFLYISDTGNNVIRRVDMSTGIITTVVGNGTAGFAGDGGSATAGMLNYPWGIALGGDGSLYIADLSNNRIRRVSPAGTLSTVAGSGIEGFGGDGGPATQAMLNVPAAVAVDVAGNMYIADSGNQLVRKVNFATGEIDTIAGSRSPNTIGNNGPATEATLDGPYSVSLDSAGDLYIADMFHHMIRELTPWEQSLFYPVMRVGRVSAPIVLTVENDGNGPLDFTALQLTEAKLDPATTTCAVAQAVASDATCTLGIEFAPTTPANPVTDALLFMISNASDRYETIYVNGVALSVDPTLETLTSSVNPVAIGAPVTFTSTVVTSGSSAPTGTVNFMDGAVQIGAATLNASSVATFSISTLALGSHVITAVYGGDSQNAAATSPSLTENVQQPTTTTMTSNPNPSMAETSVVFTATVTGPSGAGVLPGGTVTFYDGTLALGVSTLNVSGVATLSITSLSAGTHKITAGYGGDGKNLASQSAILVQTVSQMPTKTSVATSNANIYAGISVTFTSVVSRTDSVIPTGVVTFMDGNTSIGAGTLDGTGTTTWTATGLSAGTHSITAVYAGDANNLTSTSTVLTEIVQQIATSTTIAANVNPANAGAMLQLTATVSAVGGVTGKSAGPGISNAGSFSGTATFQDGATVLGTATVSAGGVATLNISTLSVGAHNITANYGGSTNYATSSSTPMLQTITLATTSTVLASSLTPSLAGRSVVLTASVAGTGGIPTGTITFIDGTGAISLGTGTLNAQGIATFTLSTLAVGQHSIVAVYSGDAKDSTSTSGALLQTVQIATTSVSLASSVNPSSFAAAVTFIANITTTGGTATGTVTFFDGSTALGTSPVNAGSAVFSTSTLTLGAHSITATYSGDSNNTGSRSSALNQQVLQAGGVTLASSANPSIAQSSIAFTAAIAAPQGIAATGTVTFKDGSTVLGTATVNGVGIAAFSISTLAVGQHQIMAAYSGDANNQPATSNMIVQTVQIVGTNVTLTPSVNPSLTNAPLTLTSTVVGKGGSVTGTVTFEDGSTALGAANVNSSGVAMFVVSGLSPGLHSIIAVYGGDANNSPSTSPVLSQSVMQTITVSLSSSQNPSLALDPVTFTARASNGSSKPPSGTMVFTDGTTVLGSAVLDASGTAIFTAASMAAGEHAITATYSGDAVDLASVSAATAQLVQLRPTTNVLTASSTSLTGGQQVTLISVVHFSGPVTATGTVTFTSNGTVLGTPTLDKTGVATLTVNLLTSTPTVIASYSGDSVYAASTSTQTSITVAKPTQFTMQMSPSSVTLQSKQNSTTMLTLTSVNSFTDTLDLSCAGLPFAATCTFTNDRVTLAAGGIQAIKVVVDTGSPLTAGSQARLEQHGTGSVAAICFLPAGALFGLLFWKGRRRMRSGLGGLLMVLLLAGLSTALSGCGGLSINGTPQGTYVFQVTATGTGTGVTQAMDMTLTVTQ